MSKYRDLPAMADGATPAVEPGLASPEVLREISTAAMRCGGCGSKVGATPLDRALARLQPVQRDNILIGLETPDELTLIVEMIPGVQWSH